MKYSIVIPMYNAGKRILLTLDALKEQTEKNFEVIVVDDGSRDDSYKIVDEYNWDKVRVLKQKNMGPAAARNHGVKKAKGEIVVLTDSDCIPKKDWLSEMVVPFKDIKVAGVQGTYETLNKDKLIARYVGYEIAYRHSRMKKREIDFIGSFSAAYRKEEYLRLGGFSTEFREASGEDPEFSYRLKKAGHRLVFNPKAIVRHPHPDRLIWFLKQQYKRGYWRVLMFRDHKEKIVGDSYSGNELFIQGILVGALFLSILSLNVIVVLGFLMVLFLSNMRFGVFCFRKEMKFFILGPVIASMRSIAGVLGVGIGVLEKIIIKR